MKKHTHGTSSKDFPTGQLKGRDDPANMGTHAIAIETMETALAAARIGVFELDLTTDTSNVSASWRDLMDVDLSDSIDFQTEWRKRIHPDDEALIERALTDYVSGRAPRVAVEYRLRSRDGLDWLWMRTDAEATKRDAQGNALNLVGTQRDITDKKRAEIALQGSEEQFRSLMNNAPIGTALVSLEGKWLATNAAMTSFLGYSEEELRSTDCQSITHADDLESVLFNVQKLLSGEIDSFELDKRYVRPDGEIMWGHLCVVLVRSDDGQPLHYISQILDITETRKLDFLRNEFKFWERRC